MALTLSSIRKNVHKVSYSSIILLVNLQVKALPFQTSKSEPLKTDRPVEKPAKLKSKLQVLPNIFPTPPKTRPASSSSVRSRLYKKADKRYQVETPLKSQGETFKDKAVTWWFVVKFFNTNCKSGCNTKVRVRCIKVFV